MFPENAPRPIPTTSRTAPFFGVASGLFSVLVEDSGLASTILFSVIGFLGEVSLALSTDIIFPYRHICSPTAGRVYKVREPPRIGGLLFLPSDRGRTGRHPSGYVNRSEI